MKVVTIVGARPQLIKASVVSQAMRAHSDLEEVLVHTGQHFDANMSDVFFDELRMPSPKHHLGIAGGSHGEMTGRMLQAIERVILDERPDAVLVYGDTNSTLAGTLAAVKLHVPVAHVEAGLRSFNMKMPEEVNRILTDRVSTWLFAPTTEAVAHLRREGVDDARVFLVGDVMYDVAIQHGRRALTLGRGVLDTAGLDDGSFVIVTIHRADNTDDPTRLANIVQGLREVAAKRRVVWPLHPRTRVALDRMGILDDVTTTMTLLPPQGYLDMVRLETAAAVIATDSGGVQKEAFFHGVPCVTLRDETEWTELVDSGWNRLVPPTSAAAVAHGVLGAIGTRGADVHPYGSGHSADAIVDMMLRGVPRA
jgi:UDP-GlcNAc3NAcA epimerase